MKNIIAILGVVLLLMACTPAPQEPTVPAPAGDAQVVNVGVTGAAYTFDKDIVEAGKPVRLVFDADKLPGCSRAVTVPEYDLYKVITPEDNVMEFTPMASGPVLVSCTMAMYTGELMVQ